jgi:ornithine cyclodeaminase/alanine dehydrogenase-like protein (mu-crystallin family)
MPVRILSAADLQKLAIHTDDVIASIEKLLVNLPKGTVFSAPKAVMTPSDGRYMMAALAAADDPQILAVKTVVLNAENAKRGLPTINGVVTLMDSVTGQAIGLVEGNWITAVRTAGLSASAAKRLANPAASHVAFLGTGVQAQSHLDAFADLFPLKHVSIFGRGRPNIDALAARARSLGLDVEICATPETAMRDADLVVTTLTRDPARPRFLDASVLKPGSFAAIVDLAEPWKQETFTAFERLVIDDLEQEASAHAKLAPTELVSGDLGQLVRGEIKGRTSPAQRTAFVFRGFGIGDLALAGLAYVRAEAAGVGQVVEI